MQSGKSSLAVAEVADCSAARVLSYYFIRRATKEDFTA